VIPRYATDAHFPGPVWAAVQRTASAADLMARKASLPSLRQSIIRHMDEVL
jgi:diadenosine tetraphosphate (Ap4A) HIT family hydrolase